MLEDFKDGFRRFAGEYTPLLTDLIIPVTQESVTGFKSTPHYTAGKLFYLTFKQQDVEAK